MCFSPGVGTMLMIAIETSWQCMSSARSSKAGVAPYNCILQAFRYRDLLQLKLVTSFGICPVGGLAKPHASFTV